ncbi:hypothetical protein TNCV_4001861 [Trichonephila clavipes]|uniref:HTH psq-type domain-containing protein n=1 Tax=Trichonephila clavipes TaxID=2585209 RepID=A0A8X6V847_TRICX|nr:hypothetical protein TNCV_4001861 [Trichonephila clavipes]
MGDSKNHENKATRKSISLETKMQVIRRLDTSERQSHIGAAFNLATSSADSHRFLPSVQASSVDIAGKYRAITCSSFRGEKQKKTPLFGPRGTVPVIHRCRGTHSRNHRLFSVSSFFVSNRPALSSVKEENNQRKGPSTY